jgi:ubiquinone/menaquinone biosynthesis C-methylase UbiE
MLRSIVILFALSQLSAQRGDVQKLVEDLFPKNERMKTMRVADLVHELNIEAGSKVADIGCGSGEFSVVLGKVVDRSGRVYCVDIDDLKEARRNFRNYNLHNVLTVKSDEDDPKLAPRSVDAVLIVNAYHEMEKPEAMLNHIREALKPGGRLVICDNTPHRTATRSRDAQTSNHVIAESLVAADLEAYGLRILRRDSGFIDDPDSENQHWLIVASPK